MIGSGSFPGPHTHDVRTTLNSARVACRAGFRASGGFVLIRSAFGACVRAREAGPTLAVGNGLGPEGPHLLAVASLDTDGEAIRVLELDTVFANKGAGA